MKYWVLLCLLIACDSPDNKSSDQPETAREIELSNCKLDILSKYYFINQEGKTLGLRDVVKEDYALLLTYTDLVCRPCIEHYFNLLNQMPGVNSSKIILITKTSTPRTIIADANTSGFKTYSLKTNEGCPEIEGFIEQYPRIILVNSDLEIMSNRYGFAQDSINNPKFIEIIQYLK